VRIALIILAIIVLAVVGIRAWWISTPLFAFEEAVLAFKNNDEPIFNARVASRDIAEHLVDDLLVEPAMVTPNLSMLQQSAVSGALVMAKTSLVNGMLESIQNSMYKNTPHVSFLFCSPALAESGNIKDLMQAAGHEMSAETKKQKTMAYNRMLSYIQNHPDTVPGRLLDCPPQERTTHARQMLQTYGLDMANFKGITGYSTTSDIIGHEIAHTGFIFYSPKVSQNITVEIELLRGGAVKQWQISRLSNIAALMDQLEPDYRRDLHELIEYSLSGMSSKNMANDLNAMTRRLSKDPSTQNILNRLNLKF
jgi:hypothetical protein